MDVVIDALELPATDAFNRVRQLTREEIRERLERAGLTQTLTLTLTLTLALTPNPNP